MSAEVKLPLKKVAIRADDYFRPDSGGGGPKMFGAVTPAIRNRMAGEVHSVGVHFKKDFQSYPKAAAVARVVLKDEAIAKSHRPTYLFENADCPIVGVGAFGELLVSVRNSTLPRLENAILSSATKKGEANISTIRSIEPFAIEQPQLTELRDALSQGKISSVKLRLFHHNKPSIDQTLRDELHKLLARLKIDARALNYARSVVVYCLTGVRPDHVKELTGFVGTQSVGAFPEYNIVRPAAQPVGKVSPAQFPAPKPGVEYPIVGVIDTGVNPANKLLAPWVVARHAYVPVTDRDYEHGTFVAGLLVHSRALNHGDPRFPESSCRIVDVIALPRSGRVSEHELLAILQEIVPKHPEVRVWNLSIAGHAPCSDHAFSDFAIALDELQSEHNVTFVLAAGNYGTKPFRKWPPQASLGESDRICGPADSVRAITVGSLTHRDSPAALARPGDPSPFSRRGLGPVYLPKPEVAHLGGNCDAHGLHAQIGVLSVDSQGNLAESIGTSFAAPIIAAILAHIQAGPSEPLSPLMAKALLIHSAVLSGSSVDAAEFPYRGFGMPADVSDVLGCDPWRATMLFELDVRAGVDLQRTPFPIPDCLRLDDGSFRGEMTVTVVSAPQLDGTFGAEYCRSNVEVSLGRYDEDEDGSRTQDRQVHPFPRRSDKGRSEKKLVEQGYKWSPVKVYHRVSPKGMSGETWRLTVAATDRSLAENTSTPVAMVVTIADIDRSAPVYNDVVTAMNKLGWATSDVQLRDRVRPRPK